MKLKIALIQLKMSADTSQNLAQAIQATDDAGKAGAKIICLPEMYRSLYFCQEEKSQYFDLAEALDGPSVAGLAPIAKAHQAVIVVPIFERRAAGLYHNTVVVLGPEGTTIGVYRKMHIPDDPNFYEKYYFTPGDLGFEPIDTPYGKIGVLICWDQWFPEAARIMALKGAQILIYPTAIGWHPSEKERYGAQQQEAWQISQRGHAIANACYVAAVNRVGQEAPAGGDGLEFWGHSFVADPQGVVKAQSVVEAQTLYADIDLNEIEVVRRNWPFFRDRRIDAYGELLKRWM